MGFNFLCNKKIPVSLKLTRFSKLGYKDSNLEMLESESSALPFGDSPSRQHNRLYTKVSFFSSTFLKKFQKVFFCEKQRK